MAKTDLDFEFYDLSEVQSGSLSWITIDSSTNVVTVAPTQQEFLDYDTSTISVQIKAIDSTDSDLYNDIPTFSLTFECAAHFDLKSWSIPELWEPVPSDEVAIWAGPTYSSRC